MMLDPLSGVELLILEDHTGRSGSWEEFLSWLSNELVHGVGLQFRKIDCPWGRHPVADW